MEENYKYIDNKIGGILKIAMARQEISMRRLSEISGVCTATISRIINGKQKANMSHIIAFSKCLNIPVEELFASIGVCNEASEHKKSINKDTANGLSKEAYFVLNMIQEILSSFDMDLNSVIKEIKKDLIKYEQYAKTEEGKSIIYNDFIDKISALNSAGLIVEQLKELYVKFCSDSVGVDKKAIIGSALLYFILSTDVIPDYIFPIGYLDDAIAVNLVINKL